MKPALTSEGMHLITDQGRTRLNQETNNQVEPEKRFASAAVSLVDQYDKYDAHFRSKLLDRLYELSPSQFEHFARQLLTAYGFVQMTVTQVGKDGGIDGHGMLRVGLAWMAVAFSMARALLI